MARKGLLKDLKAVRQQKKTKHQHITPVTADDFLAAGVDLEEAGEKWRVGDPVKGMRFYARAIEMYDQGLQRHPQDFDLAYNKYVDATGYTHPDLCRDALS
ncbi:hypothetical protein KEM52_005944 [Ascosphaera acerosa]|nr:hypothetical protein KEM52_005944 [Ascosphaera acerosa]